MGRIFTSVFLCLITHWAVAQTTFLRNTISDQSLVNVRIDKNVWTGKVYHHNAQLEAGMASLNNDFRDYPSVLVVGNHTPVKNQVNQLPSQPLYAHKKPTKHTSKHKTPLQTQNAYHHPPLKSRLYINRENNAPIGNAVKNAKLISNRPTSNIVLSSRCATLKIPADGDTDVPINTGLSWEVANDARGYRLSVGTSTGGVEIVDLEDVALTSIYNFTSNLAPNTTYYVNVEPYFGSGIISSCTEFQFTTGTAIAPPPCVTLNTPANGAMDVPIDAAFSWDAIPGADGYRITVGTTSGGSQLLNHFDVGNTTTYSLPANMPEGANIFVTVVPYSAIGEATGCAETSFATISPITIPPCTIINMPANGATDVAVDAAFSWSAITGADGYRMTVGTTSGGNQLLDNFDVGDVTTYSLATDMPEGTNIFVAIIPYNTAGVATGCSEISFTTSSPTLIPDCTTIEAPMNGATDVAVDAAFSWSPVTGADGYRITVGTTSGGNQLLDNVDVGNVTTYSLPANMPEGANIFVAVVPYNIAGVAQKCSNHQFTTASSPITDMPQTFYGFSPDGDGINEVWVIGGIEQYPNNKVAIYNRWGDKVFETAGYNNTTKVFAGEANQLEGLGAGQLPAGTYFFNIEVPKGHNLPKLNGYIILKR